MKRRACLYLLAVASLLPSFALGQKAAFRPNLGPDLPTIIVRCGDVGVLLRQKSQWTMGRIDFRGKPMSTEKSAYGTVLLFPNLGFIGTAHLENEPEPLESLSFELDGVKIENPTAELQGKQFKFTRVSKIRGVKLICEIELKEDRLYETTTLETKEEVPLKLLYHFMHAWLPSVSHYAAGDEKGGVESGEFPNDEVAMRKMFVNRKVDWFAAYEPTNRQFAVSRLLSTPELGGHQSMVWNVIGTYRKYYLKCFADGVIPAGFKGTWKMVTGFGEAELAGWSATAEGVAKQLK